MERRRRTCAQTSTPGRDRLVAWVGSLLLVVSCGSPVAEYKSLEEMAVAMVDAGYECTPDEVEMYEGTLGTFHCEWPSERAADHSGDSLVVTVFPSELARVRSLLGLLVWCEAGPDPAPTVSYAYGSTWVVMSGYCEGTSEEWSEIAKSIGGRANEFDLMAYETFDFERPFEDWTTKS